MKHLQLFDGPKGQKWRYSQDVADDSDGPEIRAESDLIEIDHFGCDEFRRAEQDL